MVVYGDVIDGVKPEPKLPHLNRKARRAIGGAVRRAKRQAERKKQRAVKAGA